MEALFLILKDEEVNKFLPWYPMKDIEETKKFYAERYEAKYKQPQAYAYAICLKSDNFPIGYIKVDMEEHHDFGYALRKEFNSILTVMMILFIKSIGICMTIILLRNCKLMEHNKFCALRPRLRAKYAVSTQFPRFRIDTSRRYHFVSAATVNMACHPSPRWILIYRSSTLCEI